MKENAIPARQDVLKGVRQGAQSSFPICTWLMQAHKRSWERLSNSCLIAGGVLRPGASATPSFKSLKKIESRSASNEASTMFGETQTVNQRRLDLRSRHAL